MGGQNSDSALETRIRGRGACLTQSNLYLKDGHEYRLVLEVKGQEIAAWVDGEEINRIEERPLRLRPLYLAASTEEATGDVILRAVNVQAAPVTAKIDRPCAGCTAEVLCAPPEAENTLDQPDIVKPVVAPVPPEALKAYTFPGYSMTVLRIHP